VGCRLNRMWLLWANGVGALGMWVTRRVIHISNATPLLSIARIRHVPGAGGFVTMLAGCPGGVWGGWGVPLVLLRNHEPQGVRWRPQRGDVVGKRAPHAAAHRCGGGVGGTYCAMMVVQKPGSLLQSLQGAFAFLVGPRW
jgi:hypothetical protein